MTQYTQIVNERIATEVELIIETAYRAVMFEPLDKYTMINFQNLVSKAVSKLRSKGAITFYSVDAQVTHDGQLNCWIVVTPVAQVEEINISCTIDSNGGLDISNNVEHELEITPKVRGVFNYGD